jgi:hypothetical protein
LLEAAIRCVVQFVESVHKLSSYLFLILRDISWLCGIRNTCSNWLIDKDDIVFISPSIRIFSEIERSIVSLIDMERA